MPRDVLVYHVELAFAGWGFGVIGLLLLALYFALAADNSTLAEPISPSVLVGRGLAYLLVISASVAAGVAVCSSDLSLRRLPLLIGAAFAAGTAGVLLATGGFLVLQQQLVRYVAFAVAATPLVWLAYLCFYYGFAFTSSIAFALGVPLSVARLRGRPLSVGPLGATVLVLAFTLCMVGFQLLAGHSDSTALALAVVGLPFFVPATLASSTIARWFSQSPPRGGLPNR